MPCVVRPYRGAMDGLLPWLRRSGWLYGLIALVLGVLAWRSMGDGAADSPPARAAQVVRRPEVPRMTLVHVAGAVRRPGVYRLLVAPPVHAGRDGATPEAPRTTLA